MVAKEGSTESLLAELTDAAYASALRHQAQWSGSAVEYVEQESFLDLELEIWKSLRRVLERRLPASALGQPLSDVQVATEAASSTPARQLAAEVARDLSDTSLSFAEWQA